LIGGFGGTFLAGIAGYLEIDMDPKKQRKHLRDYAQAFRNMERADAAIHVLEGMNTKAASAAIKRLADDQQRLLRLQDAAAAKLGAPYGA
jgi:hypothetical protein